MKWIIFLSLGWLQACSQKTADKGPEQFDSKYVRLIEDTSKMMLIENVVISYGDLYVEADSALLEKPKQTVTVFGIKKIRFKENEVPEKDHKDKIRYTKGDSKFYTD